MGCASSVSRKDSSSDYPDIAVCDSNGSATGTKASVVVSTDAKEKMVQVPQKEKLRGDVAKRYEAKQERQKKLKERQKKVASAAEELSSQIMEEKEMLSLTSRSRGTSRATSRAASPTSNRKQVLLKPTVSFVASETEEGASSTNNATKNGEVRVIS